MEAIDEVMKKALKKADRAFWLQERSTRRYGCCEYHEGRRAFSAGNLLEDLSGDGLRFPMEDHAFS